MKRKLMRIGGLFVLLVVAFRAGRTDGVKSATNGQTRRDLQLYKELVELDLSFLKNVAPQASAITSGPYMLEVKFAGKLKQASEHELAVDKALGRAAGT